MENHSKPGYKTLNFDGPKEKGSLVFLRYRGEYMKKIIVSPVNRSFSKPYGSTEKALHRFKLITPTKRIVRTQKIPETIFEDKNLQAAYEKLVRNYS